MNLLIALVTVIALAGLGLVMRRQLSVSSRPSSGWLRLGLLAGMAVFGLAVAGVLLLGSQAVLAQEAATAGGREVTIGLATGLAAIGAALALGQVGAASLAVIAEKPEMFGRTLIYMGLAEGIAIYGLVMSILMLGKL
jgi:V/A-type H+-transporting ATPase subunit K